MRILLLAILSLPGCAKNPVMSLFAPSVQTRAGESLRVVAPAAPAPADPRSFRFAVFGDTQVRADKVTRMEAFKASALAEGVEFFLVLGDLTEDGSNEELALAKAALDSVGIPYYTTVGNHDLFQSGAQGGWQSWKSVFGPATYRLAVGDAVQLLFLDTASGDIGQLQFEWLEAQLRDTARLTVVATHYPISDGLTPMILRLSGVEERYKLTSLLMRYGVSAYVAGHLHAYVEDQVGSVRTFIAGSMYSHDLDFGAPGYLLLTYANGTLAPRWVALP